MSYNLNFYPNDYNNSAFNTQYTTPYTTTDLNLQKLQQETENRLKQIQQFSNSFNPQVQQSTIQQKQEQPYYLYCGNKSDWDEFLMLNYNITEQSIFNDYKLFLQAKQEVLKEKGQTQINAMKDKIRNNTGVQIDDTVKSNVKPNISNNNGNNNGFNMGNNNKSDNRLLGSNQQQYKNINRQK